MNALTKQLAEAIRLNLTGHFSVQEQTEALAAYDAAEDAPDTHSKTCASRSQLLTDPPQSAGGVKAAVEVTTEMVEAALLAWYGTPYPTNADSPVADRIDMHSALVAALKAVKP